MVLQKHDGISGRRHLNYFCLSFSLHLTGIKRYAILYRQARIPFSKVLQRRIK